MLKEELLEILELFNKYKISEEDQRKLFENGLYFDFTYGDPDPSNKNQRLNIFGIGMLLKTCYENNITINIKQLINEPYYFPYEDLVKQVAIAQRKSYTMVSMLGRKTSFNEAIRHDKADDKLIDMHTHTNYSDGELAPQELIKLAIDKNIGTLAITDHDTIEGIKTVNKQDKIIVDSGIEIIDGIELSAKVDKGLMHILGYGIDINNMELNKKMITLRDNSINSVLSVMEQIKRDYGIRFGYDDIKELVNANHNLGRPDLAKLCVKYGYATTSQDAFDKYLIDAHNKTRQTGKGLQYQECLELIKDSGGIPVLAHPKSLELSEKEFLILLKEMISCGLKGIEVYHSSHSKEEMDYYLEIANKYGLLISGGSDFHGKSVKPDIELGTGKDNNIKIKKLSLLDKLHK